MNQKTLEDRLGNREPPIPESFVPYLREAELGVPEGDGLALSGIASLRRALRHPGRVRNSAFHLLAADALLTYACEDAGHEPDIRSELERLIKLIGDAKP